MEVLYHIRPYFGGISPYIALKNRPYIWNRYLHFRILKFPLIIFPMDFSIPAGLGRQVADGRRLRAHHPGCVHRVLQPPAPRAAAGSGVDGRDGAGAMGEVYGG